MAAPRWTPQTPEREAVALDDSLSLAERARRLQCSREAVRRWLEDRPVDAPDAGATPPLDALRDRERRRESERAHAAELKRLLAAEAAREAYLATIREHAPLLSVPPLEKAPRLVDPPVHEWVLVLSDLHIGQKASSLETGGLFELSLEHARGQIRDLWRRVELLHRLKAKGVRVRRLTVLILGDTHEGSGMRPRQALEIDGTVTKQCVEVTDLLAWLLQQALSLFPEVVVHNVGGNHDRISQKPGLAGLGELAYHDTYAWLSGEFLRRMFSKAIEAGRLELTNWESFFGYAEIAGHRFVFEHGASFKTSTGSYGGIGWYPIQNAAGRYQQMLDGADFVVMGHFHTPALLPLGRGWQVLNGALPPSSPYVQATFKKVGTPCQVLLDLHPDVGLVDFRPIYLPLEGTAKPGAVWQRLRDERDERDEQKAA
ncbi:MAG TPA: metallophosphoesterase [Rhodothermales bacterium]|nr:metallophosphoesterase [Rhodothermales bacterium]